MGGERGIVKRCGKKKGGKGRESEKGTPRVSACVQGVSPERSDDPDVPLDSTSTRPIHF